MSVYSGAAPKNKTKIASILLDECIDVLFFLQILEEATQAAIVLLKIRLLTHDQLSKSSKSDQTIFRGRCIYSDKQAS